MKHNFCPYGTLLPTLRPFEASGVQSSKCRESSEAKLLTNSLFFNEIYTRRLVSTIIPLLTEISSVSLLFVS